ncbi:MAG: 50S ribosomal protein L13 [Gammaproteobacteria bacterium]|nr:50S ribosomal protein L13 [Gammaproteobacteria bacterium]
MKTFSAKPETVKRDWYVVDATDKVLGRLASEVAFRLRGKHKPEYTPHVDTGDHIVIVNAEKIRVTGRKTEAKNYYSHSGYPGGIKEISLSDQLDKHPTRVIEAAVKGMLPKNPLGRAMFAKLRVYAGPEHNFAAEGIRQSASADLHQQGQVRATGLQLSPGIGFIRIEGAGVDIAAHACP